MSINCLIYIIILYTRAADKFTRSSKYIYRMNDDSQLGNLFIDTDTKAGG